MIWIVIWPLFSIIMWAMLLILPAYVLYIIWYYIHQRREYRRLGQS